MADGSKKRTRPFIVRLVYVLPFMLLFGWMLMFVNGCFRRRSATRNIIAAVPIVQFILISAFLVTAR